jgi:hypothetical protein
VYEVPRTGVDRIARDDELHAGDFECRCRFEYDDCHDDHQRRPADIGHNSTDVARSKHDRVTGEHRNADDDYDDDHDHDGASDPDDDLLRTGRSHR